MHARTRAHTHTHTSHPNSSIQWNEFFEDCIEKVLQEEKEIYLLEDITLMILNF